MSFCTYASRLVGYIRELLVKKCVLISFTKDIAKLICNEMTPLSVDFLSLRKPLDCQVPHLCIQRYMACSTQHSSPVSF